MLTVCIRCITFIYILVFSIIVHRDGQWSVRDIIDSTELHNDVYQLKYIQQLQSMRSQWEKEHKKPVDINLDLKHTNKALLSALQLKEKVKCNELEAMERRMKEQLINKEGEKKSILQEKEALTQQLEEKERAL